MARSSNRALWTAHIQESSSHVSSRKIAVPGLRVPFSGLVLGVDPSVRGTGIALIIFEKSKPRCLFSETLSLSKAYSFAECMGCIFGCIQSAIKGQPLGHVAIESTVYVQNLQVAHKIGSARGAAMAAAAMAGWSVHEYAPLRIKQAVVGTGKATKDQVAKTVSQHLALVRVLAFDQADAAAAALCHGWTYHCSSI